MSLVILVIICQKKRNKGLNLSHLPLGECLFYGKHSMIFVNTLSITSLSGKSEKMAFFPHIILLVKVFPLIVEQIYIKRNFF